ncbi:hypothetical protein M9458_030054, partial [Cirrhinus mrigala]
HWETSSSDAVSLSLERKRPGVRGDSAGWPALFGMADARLVKQEIPRSVMLNPFGCNLFLLVIPVDSFSKRDGHAVEKYLGVLGDVVWSHTLVLFTSIEKHIQKTGGALQEILRKCGHR